MKLGPVGIEFFSFLDLAIGSSIWVEKKLLNTEWSIVERQILSKNNGSFHHPSLHLSESYVLSSLLAIA